MKYRITKSVKHVAGWQTFIVEADNEEHAKQVFESEGGEFEEEELEVQDFHDGCEVKAVEE